jgi:hypothetical protein
VEEVVVVRFEFVIDGLRADGVAVPQAISIAKYIET